MKLLYPKLIDLHVPERTLQVLHAIRTLEAQNNLTMSQASKDAIIRTYAYLAPKRPIITEAIVPRPFSDISIDHDQASSWVEAHPPLLRDTARCLIEKTRFIDQDHFEQKLEAAAQLFLETIGENHYYTYTPSDQDTSKWWVSALLFEKELLKNTALPATSTMHDELTPINIVISDDCSYSGTQLHENIRRISTTLRDIFPRTPIHFHCIIPFITTRALRLLASCSTRGIYPSLHRKWSKLLHMHAMNISLHTYHQETIRTFNEQLTRYEMDLLQRIVSSGIINLQFLGNKTPLVFQHKFADSFSVPRSLLKGRLIHSLQEIPFFTPPKPPYR